MNAETNRARVRFRAGAASLIALTLILVGCGGSSGSSGTTLLPTIPPVSGSGPAAPPATTPPSDTPAPEPTPAPPTLPPTPAPDPVVPIPPLPFPGPSPSPPTPPPAPPAPPPTDPAPPPPAPPSEPNPPTDPTGQYATVNLEVRSVATNTVLASLAKIDYLGDVQDASGIRTPLGFSRQPGLNGTIYRFAAYAQQGGTALGQYDVAHPLQGLSVYLRADQPLQPGEITLPVLGFGNRLAIYLGGATLQSWTFNSGIGTAKIETVTATSLKLTLTDVRLLDATGGNAVSLSGTITFQNMPTE